MPTSSLGGLPSLLLTCCAPENSCMNFTGLLGNVFGLPPSDGGIAQLRDRGKHERHRLLVRRLCVWQFPKMNVAQEMGEGHTPSFQGK